MKQSAVDAVIRGLKRAGVEHRLLPAGFAVQGTLSSARCRSRYSHHPRHQRGRGRRDLRRGVSVRQAAALVMENSGLRASVEPLARMGLGAGIPVVMLMSYRGELGENNWWAIPHGITMEPVLNALRVPYRIVTRGGEDRARHRRRLSVVLRVLLPFGCGARRRGGAMKRFDCMKALAARLKDELVILSLGASVDEWYNAAPHARVGEPVPAAARLRHAAGFRASPPACRTAASCRSIPDGGMLFNLGILATLGNEHGRRTCSSWSGTMSVTSRSGGRRPIPRSAASILPRSRAARASRMPIRRARWRSSTRIARRARRRGALYRGRQGLGNGSAGHQAQAQRRPRGQVHLRPPRGGDRRHRHHGPERAQLTRSMDAIGSSSPRRALKPSYDYVVVGVGFRWLRGDAASGRCRRGRPADRGWPGGSWGRRDRRSRPMGVAWPQARYDWGYDYAPTPRVNGRTIGIPRGRVLGGSSAINAMMWYRGHPRDYDAWEAGGAKGWSFADVLPYFRRYEDLAGRRDRIPRRGRSVAHRTAGEAASGRAGADRRSGRDRHPGDRRSQWPLQRGGHGRQFQHLERQALEFGDGLSRADPRPSDADGADRLRGHRPDRRRPPLRRGQAPRQAAKSTKPARGKALHSARCDRSAAPADAVWYRRSCRTGAARHRRRLCSAGRRAGTFRIILWCGPASSFQAADGTGDRAVAAARW